MVATPWIKRAVSYKYVTLYILFVALFCFLLRNSRFVAAKGVVIVCSGANSGCILLVVHAWLCPRPGLTCLTCRLSVLQWDSVLVHSAMLGPAMGCNTPVCVKRPCTFCGFLLKQDQNNDRSNRRVHSFKHANPTTIKISILLKLHVFVAFIATRS